MSRVALLSCFTDDYKPLADLTWNKNKALYCAKYNYTGYNIGGVSLHNQGFTKFALAASILDHHAWVWITGTDALITNFTKDVYDCLDLGNEQFSFVAASDANGLNADSVLFKNDVCGRTLLSAIESYRDHYSNEQHTTVVLTEQNPYWRDRTKIVYQWELNSYLYGLYPGCPNVDAKYGARGEWQEGDLLIHWPGTNLQRRLDLANEYLAKVIY